MTDTAHQTQKSHQNLARPILSTSNGGGVEGTPAPTARTSAAQSSQRSLRRTCSSLSVGAGSTAGVSEKPHSTACRMLELWFCEAMCASAVW